MKSFLGIFYLCYILSAQMQDINIFPSDFNKKQLSKITILDAKVLSFEDKNEISFKGVSDIAYNDNILYAISDFGYLYKLKIDIKDNKISLLELIDATHLKTKKNKNLKKKSSDAEGLFFTKEGLIVSFERKPKVSLYNFNAKKIKNFKIKKELQDISNYQKKNRALEAVVKHPIFGIITAPEEPLVYESKNYHIFYSKKKVWKFKRSSRITAFEILSDNNLLVLEREYHFYGHTIVLKKVNIMNCKKEVCDSEILAKLETSNGWTLDNFEGLAKVGDNLYLMISDDNDNFLQKTILVLFMVKK